MIQIFVDGFVKGCIVTAGTIAGIGIFIAIKTKMEDKK